MNAPINLSAKTIKVAVLAMGGEGGGVLADWIVDLGEHNGYIAQTTSVPGVAQRTGATIYYVELFPREIAERAGRMPVLALMPTPGDVDVVLASELMEAGRAVQRALVTPDRTTLLASTHRVYSIAEKAAMGDGRVDSNELIAHANKAAKRFIRFDMAQAAEANGSVISAVLFGALAGTGVLPFSRAQFEATIERGGVGVKPSLRAFGAAFATAEAGDAPAPSDSSAPAEFNPRDSKVAQVLQRVRDEQPAEIQHVVVEGVRRMLDYQDVGYAGLYLDRLQSVRQAVGVSNIPLLRETARHLALWMSYEDTIRVADLKTRGTRFERVRGEVRAGKKQLLAINEFMHPRVEEICETLPAGLGRWLMKPHFVHRLVRRFTTAGRVVTTSSLRGYLMLWTVARLRAIRRCTLRYALETERIENWLAQVLAAARLNPALALEVVQCQRLVKGYSDTHVRGLTNYQTLMSAVVRAGARLAPATLRELREAALADEHGKKLKEALVRHALA
ncbi:Indolepyruvate oxidoreductase subunit IorB [Cupriavidus taiwanensis]|uniref:indolepyruvate oxidoreductase subunit beta family protein n=1 Tax=Cupriavidus taiwanensis TaxID=164546 RepID=UPI000E1AD2B5|nr:indolepyruvate oxidoreductase subunit beta family protein [Cupriavidus taiwanensis]SOY72251.1 Indolepyruvate oxidoreductase subunit IorB [Cupriavidus taiwanensis]SOZ75031.1 Indolepyruvate oxidoreductase subunit IorB [Cupriavidus taiwanensis]SOZ88564.1 Indolepyruvate oxidoreductase subunit IorB [Cupriavidus taiwanensis]SOZ91854.1 Indolepyruvate oxidoreductase subunit IorB [Cupriavidus taiwanensis]SOZ95634.1 Indolepyruvate oxidoreductase subunit IorB [Cupriavidus taiwanensis]